MQRGLRITVAVAIATGAAIATAGTALASDNGGPINVHQTRPAITRSITSGTT